MIVLTAEWTEIDFWQNRVLINYFENSVIYEYFRASCVILRGEKN